MARNDGGVAVETHHTLANYERAQLFARGLGELFQRIHDGPAAFHDRANVSDRPVGGEIGLNDRLHDDLRAGDRTQHPQNAHPADHGVEIDDLRHIWLTVDDRVATGL